MAGMIGRKSGMTGLTGDLTDITGILTVWQLCYPPPTHRHSFINRLKIMSDLIILRLDKRQVLTINLTNKLKPQNSTHIT